MRGALVGRHLAGDQHVILQSNLLRRSRVASVYLKVVFVVTSMKGRATGHFVSVAKGNLHMIIAAMSKPSGLAACVFYVYSRTCGMVTSTP